jgi:hypothetical protein
MRDVATAPVGARRTILDGEVTLFTARRIPAAFLSIPRP